MAIARIALPVASHSIFDYWLPPGLDARPGSIVRVHLARRAFIGVVVECSATTDIARDKLLPIDEVVSALPPLTPDLLALADFVSSYYQEPLGQVLAQMLPPLGSGRARASAIATDAVPTTAGGEAVSPSLN